jgi:galactonate dehydratase
VDVGRRARRFVKIYTNQGLIGLGQAHMSGKEPTVAAAILQLREQLIGRDPTAIEANWDALWSSPRLISLTAKVHF